MHLFAKISPATTRPFVNRQPALRVSLLTLSLLAALGQGMTAARAAEPRIALAGSSSPAPKLRSAQRLGRLDSNATLRVGLTLPLRNQSQLDELLRRQYTPGDSLYHQFLTPPDFTNRFGPTQQDYDAVAAYARAQGLTVTETSPGRTLLAVTGPSARVESAFGVQMNRYRLAGGQEVFANSAAPTLPRSIAVRVAGIAGLNNVAQMRPDLERMTAHPLVGSVQSGLRSNAPIPISGTGTEGSGPLGGLAPNDIKYAYDLNTIAPLYGATTTTSTAVLTGAGVNVGLFELDGFYSGDIIQYATEFALPTVFTGADASVTTKLLGGFSGVPLVTTDQGGQTEVTLDIDMILALAPAATGVYVYEDDQNVDTVAPLTIFTRMANDLNPDGSKKPLLQVISCSWGVPETLEDPSIISFENALFQQMATQGQSLFCATGDNGAYPLFDATAPALTSPTVNNPASQPFATGVGGTTLKYSPPATAVTTGVVTPGAYVSETAWSAGTAAVDPEGSGGGVSSIWSKPSYQLGVGSSPTRRDVPDVSLNADPNTGYSIYVGSTSATPAGTAEVIGGTSAAAPLWAAYTALIDQQRTLNGLTTSVGFLNPLIYSIGASSTYSADFHDIISGSNLFYQAGVGYDDATGYGSFIGAPLLAALSANANQGTGTATLTGFVTDSSTSATPIAGATVTATVAATGAVAATTTTDTTGSYTLTVPSGLALIITVGTSAVTAPTTETLTGQTLTVAALTASTSTTQSFTLLGAHSFAAGLQMISAPFDYSGIADFATLFGLTEDQARLSPRLAQYEPLTSSYVFYPTAPADTIRLGQGYWVRFPSIASIEVTGTAAPTTTAFSIPLQQGWNQIGDPFTVSVLFADITVIASTGATGALATSTIVLPTLYDYNTTSLQYDPLAPVTDPTTKVPSYTDSTVDLLSPYVGYWVFAYQSCTLSVPVPGSSAPPPAP
ncbi:MAG: S53 family peptidase [Janthinobacterium lividum]